MTYRIIVEKGAEKGIRRISYNDRQRIDRVILSLTSKFTKEYGYDPGGFLVALKRS